MKRIFVSLILIVSFALSSLLMVGSIHAITIGGFGALRGGAHSIAEGSSFSTLRTAILAAFPEVTITQSDVLTDAYLSSIDILLISSATGNQSVITPLTSDEQNAVRSFVEEGGHALLLAENDSLAPDADAANESVIDPFGLDIKGTLSSIRGVTVTDPPAHPVTNGPFGQISSFTLQYPGWFNNLGPYATSLATLDDNGESALAVINQKVITPTSGVCVFFSDSNFLANQNINEERKKLVLNSIAFMQSSLLVGSIGGYVTDWNTGTPVRWALVIASQKPIKTWTLTQRDGYYELEDLPIGDWWVIVLKKGYQAGIAKVTVEVDKTTTKDFQLRPT